MDTRAPLIVYRNSAGGNAEERSLKVGGEFVRKSRSGIHGIDAQLSSGWCGWGWWGAHALKGRQGRGIGQRNDPGRGNGCWPPWNGWFRNMTSNRQQASTCCGISMGGSGALGLGNGVTATSFCLDLDRKCPPVATHVMERMRFPPPPVAGNSLAIGQGRRIFVRSRGKGSPDAPPILNFSSHTDAWARDQPEFLRAVHDGRHALGGSPGARGGHTNSL